MAALGVGAAAIEIEAAICAALRRFRHTSDVPIIFCGTTITSPAFKMVFDKVMDPEEVIPSMHVCEIVAVAQ